MNTPTDFHYSLCIGEPPKLQRNRNGHSTQLELEEWLRAIPPNGYLRVHPASRSLHTLTAAIAGLRRKRKWQDVHYVHDGPISVVIWRNSKN